MADFTKQDVLALAGERSYGRGVQYVDSVEELEADDVAIYAEVQGGDLYRVRLTLRDGLDGECDCPYGEDGNFCKHCVAVALAYLYAREHGEEIRRRPDLRPYLETLDHGALVELLLEASQTDRRLRHRLEDRASPRSRRRS
ncbi:SWIM zinc finger family protein [Actinomadura miaoliensis]|uniref:SWIM-type domain-containing protein n=1 Tax=Actinomadura miaoliensis TaxID=430685 RepID=A0ABP7W024_9ACTN